MERACKNKLKFLLCLGLDAGTSWENTEQQYFSRSFSNCWFFQWFCVKYTMPTSKSSLNPLVYTIVYAALHCCLPCKEQINRWHLIAQSFELSIRIEKCGFILSRKQNWWHFHAHLLEPNGLDAFCAHGGYLHAHLGKTLYVNLYLTVLLCTNEMTPALLGWNKEHTKQALVTCYRD